MRALAVVLAGSLITSGCAVNSYRIPPSELARLSRVAPEARGQRVRVIQEIVASEVPAAPAVTRESEVVIVPQVEVSVGVHRPSRVRQLDRQRQSLGRVHMADSGVGHPVPGMAVAKELTNELGFFAPQTDRT